MSQQDYAEKKTRCKRYFQHFMDHSIAITPFHYNNHDILFIDDMNFLCYFIVFVFAVDYSSENARSDRHILTNDRLNNNHNINSNK